MPAGRMERPPAISRSKTAKKGKMARLNEMSERKMPFAPSHSVGKATTHVKAQAARG